MPIHTSSYEGGIDRDSSKNKYPPGSYYKMKNFRLISFNELSNGAFSSVKGNSPVTITGGTGYDSHFVIGQVVIRNYLVVWTTACTDAIGGLGTIWRTDLSVTAPVWTPIYEDSGMLLTTQHPILEEAIGVYESSTIINVYWTDAFNMFRHINIATAFTGTIDQLNILPNVTFDPPIFRNIGTGNIYVGKIQYAYQSFNLHGTETTFSQCTPLIHLTQSSESLSGSMIRTYEGSNALDVSGNPNISGKSVTIEIANPDSNYDKIRVVAILYRNYNQEPEIHIVGEYDTSTNMIITDTGVYSLGTISLNAFRTLGNAQLYCKTVSQKGNKAVIANITQKFFDIDFDARAYRYSPYNGVIESFRTITDPTKANIINGSTTNTNIYFTYTTPVDIAAKTDDAMGLYSILNSLIINYTETGPFSDISGEVSITGDGAGSGNMTLAKGSDNSHITVTITNFPTVAGINIARTVTGVSLVNSNENSLAIIGGNWHTASHSPVSFGSTKVQSTITVVSYIGTTLILSIATSGTPYFDGTYDHFHSAQTVDIIRKFVFTYSYTQTLNYTETYTASDVTFHRDTVALNPTNWLWHLTKNSGNYIPCIGTFDPTKITSITMSIKMDYSYKDIAGRIQIYDTGVGALQLVVQSDVGWPNDTFLIVGANVPDDHDCICPYNIDMTASPPAIDETAAYSMNDNSAMFQDKGCTLVGGIGPNVKYEFVNQALAIEKSPDPRYNQPDVLTIGDLASFASQKNPFVTATMMHYKYDEVYRHGLVLTNANGQDSFVKWIGDIKTPSMQIGGKYQGIIVYTGGTYQCNAYPLGIRFTINTAALLAAGVTGMRIVRVERTDADKTILTQGVASTMFLDNGGSSLDPYDNTIIGYPRVCNKKPTEGTDHAKYVHEPKVVQFISPEINYLKKLVPTSTDYIKVAARLISRISYLTFGPGNPPPSNDTQIVLGTAERTTNFGLGNNFAFYYDSKYWINFSKYLTTYITGLATLPVYGVAEGVMAGLVEWGGQVDNKINLTSSPGGKAILNRSIDFDASDVLNHEGPSGTCCILVLDDDMSTDVTNYLTTADELELFLFDYKRPGVALSMYGGITYEARQHNTYIECGKYMAITGGSDVMDVYGGDTYIDFFEHLKTMWESDDNDGDTNQDVTYLNRFCAVVAFPCETTINIGLDNGFKYSKYYTEYYINAIREDAGNWNGDFVDHAGTMLNHLYDLIQDRNMYMYNAVYSQSNITKIYLTKPVDWLNTVSDDTLVKISLEKVSREEVDSYLKFLTDNEKMLPTQFGPINDLFLFKNYMMVFFDHAFGTISIDERAILPVQNNSILELGSANNLQFFDFISDVSGSIHPSSINRVGNGFAWFDAYNGSFGFYSGETQDLGFVKGLSSDIHSYSDNIKISGGAYYNNQLAGGNFLVFDNRRYKESFCAMIVSDIGYVANPDQYSVTFSLTHLPACVSTGNDLLNTMVAINGVELYADVSGNSGVGTLTINTSDNPSLNPAIYTTGNYFIYFKDLSTVFAFSNLTGNFQHELDMFPQFLIQYNEDLFEIFYRKVIYKENAGNYGQFYGIYRNGEMEYLINPQRSLVCLFNNYHFAMEAFNSAGDNIIDDTWDSVQMFNDYQYSVDAGTNCTCQNAGDTITKASHGLLLNTRLMFSGGAIPAEIDPTLLYWLINPTTNTFQISLTKGGTPVVLNSDGNPIARIDNLTLSGTSGTATISCNGVSAVATWNTSLNQTAIDFVATNAAAFAAVGITISAPGAGVIRFTAVTAGLDFYYDTIISNLSLTLNGSVVHTTPNTTSLQYHLLDVPLTLSVLATEGTIRRRMRTWRLQDLRDWRTDSPRMRDTYIRLLFKYLHGSNRRIVMHDLHTFFTVTRESIEKNDPSPTYARNV